MPSYPPIKDSRLPGLLRSAREMPWAHRSVEFPHWYLQQWHFHRDGYLSRAAARWYDLLIDRLYNAGQAKVVHRTLAREAQRRGTRRIVDLGCGPGNLVESLGASLPEAEITGIDLSPFMLERANGRVASLPNVRFEHRDLISGGSPVRDVDMAVAVHLFGHLPRDGAGAVLQAAAGALGKGGVVLSVDHAWHRPPPLSSALVLWKRRPVLCGLLLLREYRLR